ncbi:MAG: Ig-like domain-containing protein, partial [Chloroflexota bacterium]
MNTKHLFRALALLTVVALACQCAGLGVTPTATPRPTPTPFNPVVADRFPGRGDELPVDGAIDVYFDQPMDRASVESAFSVTWEGIASPIAGAFAWLDDSTVRFTPAAPLERATRYTVTIGENAVSKTGLAMGAAYSFTADTVGFLEVTQVLPAPDSTDVDVNSIITVMFNRPVVPLGLPEGDTPTLPNPLTFDPPIPGAGEWLNTSIFVFHPDKPLAGSATYTATVKAGLGDTTGGLLKEDFHWSFNTLPPAITNFEPFFGALDVKLTEPITVTFNQPMEALSTQGAFSLADGGGVAVAGSFKWNDESTAMTFSPRSPLKLGTTYTATVNASAKAADGITSLNYDQSWTFNTALYPGILATDPSDDSRVDTYYGFRVYFASSMDEKTLKDNVSISPDAKISYDYYSDYDKSYYISFDFEPSTAYTVTLGPDMADPYGNRIGTATAVTFTAKPLEPSLTFNTQGEVGTYSAYAPTSLYIAYRNFYDLRFRLYRMSLNDFAAYTGPSYYGFRQSYAPTDLLRDWPVSAEPFPNELAYLNLTLTEDGSALPPGTYFLRADGPGGAFVDHVLVVSKINLTFKVNFDEALVWATDLQTGQPVPDLPLIIYDDNFRAATGGSTDANGLYRATFPASTLPSLWDGLYAASSAGESFAVAYSQWTGGVDAYDFNQTSSYYPRTENVYLYTDRPVYRPGQVVSFNGVVRAENDARFSLPDVGEIQVRITN